MYKKKLVVVALLDKDVVECFDEGVVACLDKNNKYTFNVDLSLNTPCYSFLR